MRTFNLSDIELTKYLFFTVKRRCGQNFYCLCYCGR